MLNALNARTLLLKLSTLGGGGGGGYIKQPNMKPECSVDSYLQFVRCVKFMAACKYPAAPFHQQVSSNVFFDNGVLKAALCIIKQVSFSFSKPVSPSHTCVESLYTSFTLFCANNIPSSHWHLSVQSRWTCSQQDVSPQPFCSVFHRATWVVPL